MSDAKLEGIQPKTELEGTVKQIELTGAILDVGLAYDALLLSTNMDKRGGGTARAALSIGDKISVWVLGVDDERGFISVSTQKPAELEWSDIKVGDTLKGRVIRIKKFGVFVDVGAERPGLVHISELSHEFVTTPQDKVQRGEEIEVKVIGLDLEKKQIDLSVKALEEKEQTTARAEYEETYEEVPTAMALAFEKARDGEKAEASSSKKQNDKKKTDNEEIFKRTLKGRES